MAANLATGKLASWFGRRSQGLHACKKGMATLRTSGAGLTSMLPGAAVPCSAIPGAAVPCNAMPGAAVSCGAIPCNGI